MKKAMLLFLLLSCVYSVSSQSPVARTAASQSKNLQMLPIKKVILYSNGVAHVERRGIVTGNTSVDLSFKQSQVDDVLKSMLVLDLGKGRIGAVSYNSSAPPSARMAEIPFSVVPKTNGTGTGGIAGVLSQLQGANVLVTSNGVSTKGAILTVEQIAVKNEKEAKVINNLVIASESGEIRSFDLAKVRGVKLLDTDTKRDLNEFAGAAASSRRRDAKTITVTSEGVGRRELMVSYTIAAPIWKTTYRVVLDDEGHPFFQGWAIVDNVSEEDWKEVQLSLVSGSPVSFIQNLQRPYYKYRPVVPIPNDINIAPQVYESGTQRTVDIGDTRINTNVSKQQINALPNNKRSSSGLQLDGASGSSNTFLVDGAPASTVVSDALNNQNSGVQTAASGEEIGDLFQYRIEQPMTVLRNRSALIPIVQVKMEGEKVSVYNESVRKNRPLSGMRLVNSTPLTFENGSLTVIERDSYAGEALMERLKPKEQRLITYALDLGTHVRVRQTSRNERASLVKAVNGVIQIHYFKSEEKIYEITNQTDRKKVIYVEYPIRQGWKLNESIEKPDYTTQRFYRFRVELAPFEDIKLPIAETQPLMNTYRIGDLNRQQLNLFVRRSYIDDETRNRLDKLIKLRDEVASTQAQLRALKNEEQAISVDQARLRENITALSKTPEAKQLITRYIQKADSQETRIEQIGIERKRLNTDLVAKRNRLAAAIREFSFERKT
ncbi:MAG: hypothetical protein HKN33_10285 [Pyrinomonadaceae bacterium]|nr:hypothetical protein [Pyrinomonadaceae bacterium]